MMRKRGLTILAVLLILPAAAPLFAAGRARRDLAIPQARFEEVERLALQSEDEKAVAWAVARREGWSPREKVAGRLLELMAIRNGLPFVYTTTNVNAAISTGVNQIRNVPPYSLNGAGLTIGIWDGGAVMLSHRELSGRVNVMDGGSPESHATHVGGTIGASGVSASALGMAPSVTIDSYEWNSDLAEATSRAMSYAGEAGMIQLSNHSYSFIAGWYGTTWYGTWGNRESDSFGIYNSYARSWDNLCYNAPYYLPFKSAGNDRNDNAPSAGTTFSYYQSGWQSKPYDPATDPYSDGWDNGGFDTIGFIGNAKNIMTVGAVNDAVSGGSRLPSNGTMTSFSGWGPTDDGRVKPDIVANGVNLYSSTASSTSSYAYYSGTSMSSPNAMGSAALLIEYYGELFPGQYMRASTLKGLIIHTADDLGRSGPDYSFGWGLMNAKAAADHIKLHSDDPGDRITEAALNVANPTRSFTFTWDGSSPIRATLCWTDPPASAVSGLDNPSARLVNDLDLRIIGPGGSPTYSPFKLNLSSPAATATTGDNTLDTVEQVLIASPGAAGTYTVQVSHKGTLTDSEQYFSLLIGGAAGGGEPIEEPPQAPATVNAATGSGSGEISLSWSYTAGATGYKIFYDEDSSVPPFSPTQDGNPASGSDVGNVTQVTITGLTPSQVYYCAVKAYNGYGESGYSATDSAASGNGAGGEPYEPNNTSAQATPISVGTSQDHTIVPGDDEDWLTFTLSAATDVVIQTSGTPWDDTVMRLYDGDLSQVAYDDDSGSGYFSRIAISLSAGTYYIKITEYWSFYEIAAYSVALTGRDDSAAQGADILWHNATTGQVSIWLMNGMSIWASGSCGFVPTVWSIKGVGDFDADGTADILWHNATTGQVSIWLMNGMAIASSGSCGFVPTAWEIKGVGDFDADGKADIVWRHATTGQVAIWLMNGMSIASSGGCGFVPTAWEIKGVGDLDANGTADILWRNATTGEIAIWLMNGMAVWASSSCGVVPTVWRVKAVGDFDADGTADVVWYNDTTGQIAFWLMNGTTVWASSCPYMIPPAWGWRIKGTGDFDADGKADILWRHDSTGQVSFWLMNGMSIVSSGSCGAVPTVWKIKGLADFDSH